MRVYLYAESSSALENPGVIVGIAIGALLVVVVALFVRRRRRKARRSDRVPLPSGETYGTRDKRTRTFGLASGSSAVEMVSRCKG